MCAEKKCPEHDESCDLSLTDYIAGITLRKLMNNAVAPRPDADYI
jgi:hypothetical protein